MPNAASMTVRVPQATRASTRTIGYPVVMPCELPPLLNRVRFARVSGQQRAHPDQRVGRVVQSTDRSLTRSPHGRCSFDRAATWQATPGPVRNRASPNPVGPAS